MLKTSYNTEPAKFTKSETSVEITTAISPDGKRADIIKVSATSRSTAVAGAIAGVMREYRFAEVQAIGAGAVNQALKAVAIARGYLEQDGISIHCIPQFCDVDINGQDRTAIRFTVEPRQ